jgi:hypothetical protein
VIFSGLSIPLDNPYRVMINRVKIEKLSEILDLEVIFILKRNLLTVYSHKDYLSIRYFGDHFKEILLIYLRTHLLMYIIMH